MKLRKRFERQQPDSPGDYQEHVIIMMESQTRAEAIALYGAHRLAKGDGITFVILCGGELLNWVTYPP